MHPNRRYPYSIDFACFKKYLDRVAVVMVNSPMLARHLDHPPRRKSFPCILLQPLCALFSSAALSFQSLAACKSVSKQRTLTTFRINTCEKQGEGGIPQLWAKLRFRRHMRHVTPLSPVPSLDCTYFPSPRGCTTP